MERFYQNLLQKKLSKAEALREAKQWLRQLSRTDAKKEEDRLVTRGKTIPVDRKAATVSERPFEHPYYWAAFILIGDPE
jgi:CHAT domain-containing protein